MSINLELECAGLSSLRRQLARRAAAAQTLLTRECKAAADEFTPVNSGKLRDNFSYIREPTDGQLAETGWTYHEPYARAVWEGVADGGAPMRFSATAGSRARRRWTEHGAAARKDEIIAKVIKELEE